MSRLIVGAHGLAALIVALVFLRGRPAAAFEGLGGVTGVVLGTAWVLAPYAFSLWLALGIRGTGPRSAYLIGVAALTAAVLYFYARLAGGAGYGALLFLALPVLQAVLWGAYRLGLAFAEPAA